MAVLQSFRQCQNGPSGEQWALFCEGNAAIAHNRSRRCVEMLISLRRDGCFCAEKRFRLCAKHVPAMRKAATFCAQRRSGMSLSPARFPYRFCRLSFKIICPRLSLICCRYLICYKFLRWIYALKKHDQSTLVFRNVLNVSLV